ncbi:hypothetical protein AN191_12550 [Loktanella sp. 5RATIMAR09]|nr:hypothetical protein AN191_12550 [Loktanella sp. 5RATIMAR09]
MQTLGDAREHFWRVIKMADACEVDLSTALDENRLNIDEYADIITGCRGCTQVGKCDRLLADAPKLARAPEYCENRDTFGALRPD